MSQCNKVTVYRSARFTVTCDENRRYELISARGTFDGWPIMWLTLSGEAGQYSLDVGLMSPERATVRIQDQCN